MYTSHTYKKSRIAYMLECAFEYFVALMMTDSFLARLLKNLGMSDSLVGVVSSLISLSFLFQLFAVPVIRKIRRKKKFSVLVHILGQFSFGIVFMIPFIPLEENVRKILCIALIIFAYFGNYLVSSYIYYWGNSFVEPKDLGIFSAKKEMISLISGAAVQLAAGIVVDKFIGLGNTNGAFLFLSISIFVYAVVDVICLLNIKSRDNYHADGQQEEHIPSLQEIISNTFGKKEYRAVVAYDCIYKFAIYSVLGFVGTYKLNELGLSMTTIQIINIAATMARFGMTAPFGKYADKHSFLNTSILGMGIMALSGVALMFTTKQTIPLIIVYTLLYQLSAAGTGSNMLNITYNVVDVKYFSEAFAMKNAVGGLVGFFASLVCGKLLSVFQMQERILFGVTIYGQQALGLVSVIMSVAAIIFAKTVVKKHVQIQRK